MKTQLPVRKAILWSKTYEAAAAGRAGKMRLDFNENTAGCGPAVLRELVLLSPHQFAMYPEYQKSSANVAKCLSVRRQELLLTDNGGDAARFFSTLSSNPIPVS